MIKVCCGRRCAIREDNYSKSLAKFLRLFEEAQRDFPGLNAEDAVIVQYGGERIKRIMGIEFLVPDGVDIPPSYKKQAQLEYTL